MVEWLSWCIQEMPKSSVHLRTQIILYIIYNITCYGTIPKCIFGLTAHIRQPNKQSYEQKFLFICIHSRIGVHKRFNKAFYIYEFGLNFMLAKTVDSLALSLIYSIVKESGRHCHEPFTGRICWPQADFCSIYFNGEQTEACNTTWLIGGDAWRNEPTPYPWAPLYLTVGVAWVHDSTKQ